MAGTVNAINRAVHKMRNKGIDPRGWLNIPQSGTFLVDLHCGATRKLSSLGVIQKKTGEKHKKIVWKPGKFYKDYCKIVGEVDHVTVHEGTHRSNPEWKKD